VSILDQTPAYSGTSVEMRSVTFDEVSNFEKRVRNPKIERWTLLMAHSEVKQEIQRDNSASVYLEQLKPLMSDKKVAAIIEKLVSRVDRINNLELEMYEKNQEVERLLEQAESLEEQYNRSLDRETLRAKMEVEKEINLINAEIKVLMKKKYYGSRAWTVDLSPEELQTLEKAYEPYGVKERKLFVELQKSADQYAKASQAFKEEYDGNIQFHNYLLGLVISGNGTGIKLNRVNESEVYQVIQEVNVLR
jgi:hypothetical protein